MSNGHSSSTRKPVRGPARICSALLVFLAPIALHAQSVADQNTADEAVARGALRNKPERLEAFRDQALGMFIHWSVDSQLGPVISHSLVGADESYARRFFEELPKSFNPTEFDPTEWAALAKLCGFKYAVFTNKHHSGFCMFPTRSTGFSIANTPYQKDVTKMYVDAFRAAGLGMGFYFSPDDFWLLHQQGIPISRYRPTACISTSCAPSASTTIRSGPIRWSSSSPPSSQRPNKRLGGGAPGARVS